MADPRNPTPTTAALIAQLAAFLRGGNAHVSLEDATADLPADLQSKVPPTLPYSAWQLIEHLRLAQRDILDFSAPPPGGYKHLRWPQDYWPTDPAPPTPDAWHQSLAAIHADRDRFIAILSAPDADLFTPFSWGEGQNLLREALLIADHNSYHIGELIVLRRLLGAWKR